MAKIVVMVGALVMGMNCLAANFWPIVVRYLDRFLYDYEEASLRWGNIIFLVVIVMAIVWAKKHDEKKLQGKERRRAAGEEGESALRKLCGCLVFILCPLAFIATVLILIKLGVISKY